MPLNPAHITRGCVARFYVGYVVLSVMFCFFFHETPTKRFLGIPIGGYMHGTGNNAHLPENAFRKLKPGEVYQPIVPASSNMPQWTFRAVLLGIITAVIFSAAAAFLGFKVGQVIEAAIPIAIIAVGVGSVYRRRASLLENVIVQSVGAASGLIVAGAIFVLPALFILELPVDKFIAFMASLLGGVLGVLLLIPLRRYFVKEMHGEYPFPEATATTEILVAGESGGTQAKILMTAAVVGGIYDFLQLHAKAFSETITTYTIPYVNTLLAKLKLVFKIDVLASVLGLGYIIGLHYSLIITLGSLLSWFIMVPLVAHFGHYMSLPVVLGPNGLPLDIAAMTLEQIFKNYVRLMGIGGIACAGMIGIWRSRKIIVTAFSLGFRELFKGKTANTETVAVERTDHDFSMKWVAMGLIGVAIALFLFFSIVVLKGQPNPFGKAAIALIVVMVISFLFTTVAAQAIATVGTNPVSGMTLMTLILSAGILVAAGLKGPMGMMSALLIGCVVCTALSVVGGFVTDLKVGYWLGATPSVQQKSKLLGIVVSALTVGTVMILLNQVYGFVQTPAHPEPLSAPQANAMAAVVKAMMSDQPAPWMLYGIGAAIILILQFFKVPGLAFALGMYIPLELNTPLLVGGFISHMVIKSAQGNEKLANARNSRGTLIASGFIAGGAIMGVIAALMRWASQKWSMGLGVDFFNNAEGGVAELTGLVAYCLLIAYTYWDSKRAKES